MGVIAGISQILWPFAVVCVAALAYQAFSDWREDRVINGKQAEELAYIRSELSQLKDRIGPMQIALNMRKQGPK